MNLEDHPAGQNIYYLRQGAELIRVLDDELYTHGPGEPFRGGVGGQFRHCIDFYNCLLQGLEMGRVDYCRRERDARIETDRAHAVQSIESLLPKLADLRPDQLSRPLEVHSDLPLRPTGVSPWSGSTAHRELQFLVSHTIHHYALIVALLKHQGFDLGARFAKFGVAPSTLQHWEEADLLAT